MVFIEILKSWQYAERRKKACLRVLNATHRQICKLIGKYPGFGGWTYGATEAWSCTDEM